MRIYLVMCPQSYGNSIFEIDIKIILQYIIVYIYLYISIY